MLTSISFMSLAAVKELTPDVSTAVISIRDASSLRHMPPFDGFWRVLPVYMLDVAEDHWGYEPGAWPDEPSVAQHAEYCESLDDFAPSLTHAKAIAAFLAEVDAAAAALQVVVHCSAGSSRSAAVASWAAEKFGIPLLDPLGRGIADANPRVLRLLNRLG